MACNCKNCVKARKYRDDAAGYTWSTDMRASDPGQLISAAKHITELPKPIEPPKAVLPTPDLIVEALDRTTIGQRDAKRALATAAYFHYHRINNVKNMTMRKSNICMVGPTGTGKTLMLQTLADFLGVPFAIVDATELTPTGYVGSSVTDFVSQLKDAKGQKAEEAIIFIDEADKLSGAGGTRGFKTFEIQKALLKLVEGKKIDRQGLLGTYEGPPSNKMLFVLGGAFSSITSKKDYNGKIMAHDLVKHGLMPEFVGRFPIITTLKPLSHQDLVNILTEPEDSIVKEFTELFFSFGTKLIFDREALNVLAEHAVSQQTGARALRGVVEAVLNDSLFDLPIKKPSKVVVTKKRVMEVLGEFQLPNTKPKTDWITETLGGVS